MASLHCVAILLAVVAAAASLETCEDVLKSGVDVSGEYDFERDGKAYKMFCDFNGNRGYTYLPRNALEQDCSELFGGVMEISELQTDKSTIMIRSRIESGGAQYNTLIQTLPQFNEEIRVFANNNGQEAYQGPVQRNMGPYLFAGLAKKDQISARTTQGFKSNAESLTFRNCDANPNAYFSFHTNPTNSLGRTDTEDGQNSLMGRWRSTRIQAAESSYLPENYFYDVEAHFGGCGAFEWTKRWATPTKFSLGIAFEVVPEVDANNCEEVYQLGQTISGRYNLNVDGELFEVMCQFEGSRGFTYFPKNALSPDSNLLYGRFDPSVIQSDASRVMIRFYDGEQHDTIIQQLEKNADDPIGIYVNGNGEGKFQGPTQSDNTPYMLVGFIPQEEARSRTVQGFRSNGVSLKFTNCDENPNSYFTFFKNPTNAEGRADNQDGPNSLIGRWSSGKHPTLAGNRLPRNYFMDVEAHWGGCGGFEWTKRWQNPTKFAIGIGFKIVPVVEGASCEDVYLSGKMDSGLYELQDNDGNMHEVFCQFDENRGYTFVPRKALSIDCDTLYDTYAISDMQTDKSRIMIRINDGKQYDTVIEQLDSFAEEPINTYINGNGGLYNGPINTIRPFLYAGVLPKSLISSRTVQGFKTNGVEHTFTNCDANPNAYFAFFSNKDNEEGHGDQRDGDNSFIGQWFGSKTDTEIHEYLPDRYFMDMEAHWGGCGGFEWTKRWNDRTRFALGFAFGPVVEVVTEAPVVVVTEAPEPEPTPGPNEPEVAEHEETPRPQETTKAPPKPTDPSATGEPTEPAADNLDCHKQKNKFANKYAAVLGISNPVLDSMCRFANKQCNEDVCYCVRARTGKPKYRSIQIPKDEAYNCDYTPKGCLKARFNALVKAKSYVPTCRTKKNKQYEPKQCLSDEDYCWCVKKRGKERKKTANGPFLSVNCNK